MAAPGKIGFGSLACVAAKDFTDFRMPGKKYYGLDKFLNRSGRAQYGSLIF